MFLFAMIVTLVALIVGVFTFDGTQNDQRREKAARQKLRDAGLRYTRGSERERAALRILLDGGSIDEVLAAA